MTTRPQISSPLHRGLSSVEYGQPHRFLTITLTPGESLYNGVWTVNAVALGHKYVAVTADIPPAITKPEGITYHPDYIKIVNAWDHRDRDRDPPSAQIERFEKRGISVGQIIATKGETHDWDSHDTYRNWRAPINVLMPRELDASKEEWQSSEGPLFWSISFRKGFMAGAGKTYILQDAYGQVVAHYTHAKGRMEPYILHLDSRLDVAAIDMILIVVLCMSAHWEQWYEAEKYVDHGG